MAENEDSDGSDEWGMEELVIPDNNNKQNDDVDEQDNGVDDDYWQVETNQQRQSVPPPEPRETSKATTAVESSETMILVDMTALDSNIHSKFDQNSVSDPVAASALRKKMGLEYSTYSKDASMIANGTIIPCGSTVWRDALVQLRQQRPGHYFAPIFPPCK